MNNMTAIAAPSPTLAPDAAPISLDTLADHLNRAQILLGALNDGFGQDLLEHVELRTPAALGLWDRVATLIDVTSETVKRANDWLEANYATVQPLIVASRAQVKG